jgi:hypothetical protein
MAMNSRTGLYFVKQRNDYCTAMSGRQVFVFINTFPGRISDSAAKQWAIKFDSSGGNVHSDVEIETRNIQ